MSGKGGRLGRGEVTLTTSVKRSVSGRAAPEPDSPFRILLLGDVSGRESRDVCDPTSLGFDRLPVRVDRDNLEDLMAELGIELRLRLEGGSAPTITLRPGSLDDFRPDRLFEDAPAFSGLRRLLENLEDPTTFEEAADEIRSWGTPRPAEPAEEPEQSPASGGRSTSENLVAELLQSDRTHAPAASASLDAFLHGIVRPHLVARESPEKGHYVTATENAIGSWMKTILHEPFFQALEANWRGLDFLVRRLETDGELQIHLLDVSKAELASGLRAEERLEATTPYRLLVEQSVGTPGAQPWSVLVGLYTFDHSLEDVALLGRLGKVAAAAGAPFLAAAHPRILGCESFARNPDPDEWKQNDEVGAELWQALRLLPEASFLGLALPRFLLRLPYGKATDPVETFAFEEFGDDWSHEDYLWGNPAIACACILGQEFMRYGWHLKPAGGDIRGLPLHAPSPPGSVRLQPCAEALLSDRAIGKAAEHGLMALVSMKDQDSVRLHRAQALSLSSTGLSGPWRRAVD